MKTAMMCVMVMVTGLAVGYAMHDSAPDGFAFVVMVLGFLAAGAGFAVQED